MSELKEFIKNKLLLLVPDSEKLEVCVNIGDTALSLEFFATVNGRRMQCYDMIDNGLIDEETFDSVAKEIAAQIRLSPKYKKGEVNRIEFKLAK